ncbi:hypothetical protein O3M35_011927 [Rhynocoris fuscipes]|uniref:Telomeric repeat-binding factor 2-interacting protein 1 n=1 Tax=Rhynocoris fuscipes TaxID=488301 RepID=A0AAW1CXE8_9HEMI
MDYNLIEWPSMSQYPYPNMFRSLDGHPITFYFHLDDYDVKVKFEKLVIDYGGDIVDRYTSITPTTAVMVDDKCFKCFFHRVTFKASYVVDCVTSGTLLDINKYIHNNVFFNVNKFSANDYMKVIFFREFTFTSSSSKDNCSKPVIKQTITPYNVKSVEDSTNKSENVRKDREVSANNRTAEDRCLNPCAHCMLHINQTKIRADTNHGNDSRKRQILACRNEQIASTSRDEEERFHREVNNTNYTALSVSNRQCRTDRIEDDSSCSEHEQTSVRTNRRRQIISDNEGSDNSSLFPPSQDNTTNRTRPTPSVSIDRVSSDDDEVGPPTQSIITKDPDRKHTKKVYSRAEKEAILQYIVKKDAFHKVGGINLWKKMERSNICPRRTWMSLQNHFKRSLLKELETFPFLTKYQIKLLRGN